MDAFHTFEMWSTDLYHALNKAVSNSIAPLVPKTRAWIDAGKKRREGKREATIARILQFKIAGEEVVTVPNLLSILRPILALMILPMRIYGVPTWIVVIAFVITMITDKYDGAWALLDGGTRFGEVLDPLCDKIALLIFIIPDLYHLPALIMYPLLAVETVLFFITVIAVYAMHLGILSQRAKLRANIFGKIKFSIEVVAMSFLVVHLHEYAAVLFAIAIPFAIVSAVRKTRDIIRTATPTS